MERFGLPPGPEHTRQVFHPPRGAYAHKAAPSYARPVPAQPALLPMIAAYPAPSKPPRARRGAVSASMSLLVRLDESSCWREDLAQLLPTGRTSKKKPLDSSAKLFGVLVSERGSQSLAGSGTDQGLQRLWPFSGRPSATLCSQAAPPRKKIVAVFSMASSAFQPPLQPR